MALAASEFPVRHPERACHTALVLAPHAEQSEHDAAWSAAVLDAWGLRADADLYRYVSGTFGTIMQIAGRRMFEQQKAKDAGQRG